MTATHSSRAVVETAIAAFLRGDQAAVLAGLEAEWGARDGVAVDHLDGLTVAHADWAFNVRPSNTEPLLRLNVESRGDTALMQARTDEIFALLSA